MGGKKMELFDYAEAINKDLNITILARPQDRHSKYIASFEGMPEIKDGIVLTGVCGYGITPDEALGNYAAKISNQLIVWFAYSKREEFKTPDLVHFTKKLR